MEKDPSESFQNLLLAAVLFAVDGVMLEALPVRFSVDAPILERARFVLDPLRSLRPLTGKLAIDTDLLKQCKQHEYLDGGNARQVNDFPRLHLHQNYMMM